MSYFNLVVFVSQLICYARAMFEIWRFSVQSIYYSMKVIEAGIFFTETSDYGLESIWPSYRLFTNLTRLCHKCWRVCMFFFRIWHAYVNLYPAYLELLHMFIHQLGREIWTKMWSAHFCLGHPVWFSAHVLSQSSTYIHSDFITQ